MVILFGMINFSFYIMRLVKYLEKKCIIWWRGFVSIVLSRLFKFNEVVILLLYIFGEQFFWYVFENLNVVGNYVLVIFLESFCVLFFKEICRFYTLMVLKLVVCFIFFGKEGQCVIFCLFVFFLNIQGFLSQFIVYVGYCLVIICLKSQGNVLLKSSFIFRYCFQNLV